MPDPEDTPDSLKLPSRSDPPSYRDRGLAPEEIDIQAELARGPDRREFLQKAGSVVIGGAIVAVPTVVAVAAFSDPLQREKKKGIRARLTSLDALEPGGPPQPFKVIADKEDAWTTYQDLPLGLVYVQRREDGEVVVFSAACPHAGCAVEYRREGEVKKEKLDEHYYCPCHESAFALDGEIASDGSPAKRGLDTLTVDQEKLADGEVWILFQRFKAGIAEKQAVS